MNNDLGIKPDSWIAARAAQGMITPFENALIRKVEAAGTSSNERKVLSYGLSSYGYDIRLSDIEFKVFRHIPGTVVDPKKFNPNNLEGSQLHREPDGESYFILPAHSYGLGVSLEKIKMPDNVTAIAIGKSTYARSGIIANLTPIEAGWEGHITLELSNSSSADVKIYAREGICQLLFFEGKECYISYSDRKGKYNKQEHKITLPKV